MAFLCVHSPKMNIFHNFHYCLLDGFGSLNINELKYCQRNMYLLELYIDLFVNMVEM